VKQTFEVQPQLTNVINIFTSHSPKEYINEFQTRLDTRGARRGSEANLERGAAGKARPKGKESETIRAIKKKLKLMKENQNTANAQCQLSGINPQ